LNSNYTDFSENKLNFVENKYNDLNDIPMGTSIIYTQSLENSALPSNYPTGLAGNGVLIIQKGANKYMVQLAISHGSDNIAIRRRNGSTTWTDWKYFKPS
jgi:hypothetical protein